MDIKIFQLFHKNNFNKENKRAITQNINTETDNNTFKIISDAVSSVGKASISFQAKKISPEITKTILEKAKEGLSVNDIVIALGGIISTTVVTKLLDKEAKKEQFRELYLENFSIKEIGEYFGVSEDTVLNYLHEYDDWDDMKATHGLVKSITNNYEKYSDNLIKEFIELYKAGYTFAEIANITGCNIAAIHKYLHSQEDWNEIHKINSQNSKRNVISEEEVKEFENQYVQGASIADIGQKFNHAHKTIKKHLEELPNWEEINKKHNEILNQTSLNYKQEIINLFTQGKAIKEIAQELDRDQSTILMILRKLPNFKELKEIHDEAKIKDLLKQTEELYNSGYSFAQIANLLDSSKSKIYRTLQLSKNLEEIQANHELNKNNVKQEIVSNKTRTKHPKKQARILTNDTINKTLDLYAKGKIMKEIAAELNTDINTISKIINSAPNAEEIKNLHNEVLKIPSDNIIELYKKGYTIKEIKAKVGGTIYSINKCLCSHENIDEIKKEHYENFKAKNIISPDIVEKIIHLRKQGKTFSQISNITNISSATARNYIKKLDTDNSIKKEYEKNRPIEQRRIINEIICAYEAGQDITNLYENYGFAKSTIESIIRIKQNKTTTIKSEQPQYENFSLSELEDRINTFYLTYGEEEKYSELIKTTDDENNLLSQLLNIIEDIDKNNNTYIDENKEILITFCKDLDEIEKNPERIRDIIKSDNFKAIQPLCQNEDALLNTLSAIHEKAGNIFNLLEKNHINTIYLEEMIPNEINQKEDITLLNNLFELIETTLKTPSDKNKSFVNNIIKYHYFSNSTEDKDILLYENAIENYNLIYDKKLSRENTNNESEIIKEQLGQIIHWTNILEKEVSKQDFTNETQEFVEIFIDKPPLKNKSIKALVTLENYFNSDIEQKYLLKNFEPIAKECILDQEIMKVFMDKIYSYSYNSVGEENIDIKLENAVLNDNIWQKLQPKEKADFIKTMENSIIERSAKSKGKYNVIKYEGKVKDYQIVELKIDSKWRIFGYQDPKNSKNFIFDAIGEDGKGLDKYKKEFFKSHNL